MMNLKTGKECLQEIIEEHTRWLNGNGGKQASLANMCLNEADLSYAEFSGANLSEANLSCANLRGANLSCANLRGANLSKTNFSEADLSGANLSEANLRGTNLCGADLSGADLNEAYLSCADLRGANLSGAIGIKSSIDFLSIFERNDKGIIAYKTFDEAYTHSDIWKIEEGEIISENVNYNRTEICGCGINVAPLDWVLRNTYGSTIWKVLIRWEWLPGVVVPYNSDGKIRCERVELVEPIRRSSLIVEYI